jgi:hypothetical protein
VASECLTRGDDACVVRALEGWARSQHELGLLIETYRKLEQHEHARRVMQTYVERFPQAPRATSYRAILKANKAEAEPPLAADKTPARPEPAPPSRLEQKSALAQAQECLAKGDDACIVRVLAGKARSAEELGLLCETYIVLGDHARAREVMRDYVIRFPSAARSTHYRRVLEQAR